jgi:LytS/YehU family sensor histidine kinase
LVYPEPRKALAYYGALIIAEFISSVPLWVFCRWLWRRRLSWPRLIAVTTLFCYPLGFICSVVAYVAETRIPSAAIPPLQLRHTLLYGLGGAMGSSFVLILWSGIYFGVKQWDEAHLREERLLRLEALAREAELRALRYELTPHFLLNTLNGISTLVGEGENQQARRMIARLGDFLRTTLESAGNGDVALGQEIQHMEEYLAIEQIRLGEKLRTRFAIAPDVQDVSVPNLLLQPLVENAICHGIVPFDSEGEIEILARRTGNRARISVTNRLLAAPEVQPASRPVQYGLGLTNTRERLASRYGSGYRLEIRNRHPLYWEVILEIPSETWNSSNT